jgi:hypothetical protein
MAMAKSSLTYEWTITGVAALFENTLVPHLNTPELSSSCSAIADKGLQEIVRCERNPVM